MSAVMVVIAYSLHLFAVIDAHVSGLPVNLPIDHGRICRILANWSLTIQKGLGTIDRAI